MQPLTVAEMRETLRRQGLQSLRKISDSQARPLQNSSRGNIAQPSQRGKASDADLVESLKRKLRELEDERSAFLQEGVFDLVQFLCGHSPENERIFAATSKTSESSWAAQVISSVECLRQHEREKHQEENRKLRMALQLISDSTDLQEIRMLTKTALDDLRNS